MDFLAVVVMFLVLALLIAAFKPGGLVALFRDEWRAAREETWAPKPTAGPCTVEGDDRAAHLVVRQPALGKRLRREGRSVLGYKRAPGKDYVPVLTKPVPAPPPPKAAQVYPIRRNQGGGR